MKLPLLENLKVRKFPQRMPQRHDNTFHVTQNTDNDKAILDDHYYYRTTVEVGFSSVETEPANIEMIRHRGTQMIMREVYGPVTVELIALAKMLYRTGHGSADEPMRHLYHIIDTLEGNK